MGPEPSTDVVRGALLFLIVLVAPTAVAAGDPAECEPRAWSYGGEIAAGQHAGTDGEIIECGDSHSIQVALTDPDGRTDIEWYHDERGDGLQVFRPPRFFSWTDGERGCEMIVYVAGALTFDCIAGAPPEPPRLP